MRRPIRSGISYCYGHLDDRCRFPTVDFLDGQPAAKSYRRSDWYATYCGLAGCAITVYHYGARGSAFYWL